MMTVSERDPRNMVLKTVTGDETGVLLQRAAHLAQGADPAAALPLLDMLATRVDAAHPDVLTVRALMEQRLGNREAALHAFAAALAGDPENPARLSNYAVALKQAGQIESAIVHLEKALALRPNAPAALNNLGSCLIAAARYEEACDALRRAIALKPDYVEAWNNLGVAHSRLRQHAAALDAYERALALRGDYLEAALNRVEALSGLGRRTDAKDVLLQVLKRFPGHHRAANLLAGLHDQDGDLPGAVAVYEAAIRHGGVSMPVGINLAMAKIRLGQPQDVLAVTDMLIRHMPSVTTPLALRCVALHRLGRDADRAELMGLDRFVRVLDLETVDGFASIDVFNLALIEALNGHASLAFEPAGLVTRKGYQTDDLAGTADGAIAALARLASRAIADYRAGLAVDAHPFAAARPESGTLTLWGTILDAGGVVGAHIHAPNWLSGVYYPADPPGSGRDGWFSIGDIPDELGGGGAARAIEPRAGRMILFPSFLHHRTLPFPGARPRYSFAFDFVPAGSGQPHRLRAVQPG